MTPNVFKEIRLLADHHLAILQSRFSDYDYAYLSSPPTHDDELRLRISVGFNIILVVLFSPSHVRFVVYQPGNRDLEEEISYADPRFTDDFLSDILGRLVAK